MKTNSDWTKNLKVPTKIDGTSEEERQAHIDFINSIPTEERIESMSDEYSYLDD